MQTLADLRGFVLDMDGVLYRGAEVRNGAREFIAFVQAKGIPYLLLTNNSLRTAEMYTKRLASMGFAVPVECIMGSAEATASWLREQQPGARVMVIGGVGLEEALRREGFTLVPERPVDVVVVGIDLDFTYDKARRATLAIRDGARLIGTNPDTTFPSEVGIVPGAGSILAMLEAATGQEPEIVGKPALPMMAQALRRIGTLPDQTAMVGDRLDTDILGGIRAGMPTIFIRGGVMSDAEYEASSLRPTWVFDDLAALLEVLTGG
ncbi:MAG: HAD-IIA family hydrolase [Ardenticatenaceae bacterium]|nr:HAD-IIA family hydrolase [Ardenticatenaceae bacterium]